MCVFFYLSHRQIALLVLALWSEFLISFESTFQLLLVLSHVLLFLDYSPGAGSRNIWVTLLLPVLVAYIVWLSRPFSQHRSSLKMPGIVSKDQTTKFQWYFLWIYICSWFQNCRFGFRFTFNWSCFSSRLKTCRGHFSSLNLNENKNGASPLALPGGIPLPWFCILN